MLRTAFSADECLHDQFVRWTLLSQLSKDCFRNAVRHEHRQIRMVHFLAELVDDTLRYARLQLIVFETNSFAFRIPLVALPRSRILPDIDNQHVTGT